MGEKENRRLEQMKQEYKDFEVPEKAKIRIMEGIQMAKKQNRKQKVIQAAKGAGIACAASLALVTLLANSNASVAYAMEQIPVLGSIIQVVTFRDYKDKTNEFEAKVEIPKITVEKTETEDENGLLENIETVNKSIEEYANELIVMYENDLKVSEGEGKYLLESKYQVIRDDERYLCIRIETLVVMAGGTQSVKIFNVDKATGKVISLSDLFEDSTDYIDIISRNILEQMKAEMAENERYTYFIKSDEMEWGFDKITGEENFYLNESGELVISFDEYKVAPGFMGVVEFTIPKDVISPKSNTDS